MTVTYITLAIKSKQPLPEQFGNRIANRCHSMPLVEDVECVCTRVGEAPMLELPVIAVDIDAVHGVSNA